MAENAKHAPGPYTVTTDNRGAQIWGQGGCFVAGCGIGKIAEADAERIRLALACHDPLLAACKDVVELAAEAMVEANYSANSNYDVEGDLAAARAVITLAKGES